MPPKGRAGNRHSAGIVRLMRLWTAINDFTGRYYLTHFLNTNLGLFSSAVGGDDNQITF